LAQDSRTVPRLLLEVEIEVALPIGGNTGPQPSIAVLAEISNLGKSLVLIPTKGWASSWKKP